MRSATLKLTLFPRAPRASNQLNRGQVIYSASNICFPKRVNLCDTLGFSITFFCVFSER